MGRIRGAIKILLVLGLFLLAVMPVQGASIQLTDQEKAYVREAGLLRVVSIEGIAPLSYRDSQGTIKGIGIRLFDEIAALTGLAFDFELYDSVGEALEASFDIFTNAEKKYAPADMALTHTYLEAETILFYHRSLDPKDLEGKTFAAVEGGGPSAGIAEEDTRYFKTREDTIVAVESGRADYGYGNVFSVAFYTLQNNCRNVVTVPIAKEERAYCLGVAEENPILLSILNKAIDGMDKTRTDTLVLDVMSQVEPRVTPSMIVDSYWKEIAMLLSLVFAMLACIIFLVAKGRRQVALENERYEMIARMSDDYYFEYRTFPQRLQVAEKLDKLIRVRENETKIKGMLQKLTAELEESQEEAREVLIRPPLRSGGRGAFRIIYTFSRNRRGGIDSIVGKLVDVTAHEKEKEYLAIQARTDGLTDLYNATATREAVSRSMALRTRERVDALMLVDCDDFKNINDRYGHLKGDEVLARVARAMEDTFRQSDIMGRLGGDEFCIYLHDIHTAAFANIKGLQLLKRVQDYNENLEVSISVGIAIQDEDRTYEELFCRADEALYRAKGKGGNCIELYEEGWEAHFLQG